MTGSSKPPQQSTEPTESTIAIERISIHRSEIGFAVPSATPKISWSFSGDAIDWKQQAYRIEIEDDDGNQVWELKSSSSIHAPWPGKPLAVASPVTLRIQAQGTDQRWTAPYSIQVERTLADRSDWSARMISCPPQEIDRPKNVIYLRKEFKIPAEVFAGNDDDAARLYITACGMYEIEINGIKVGDQVLAPGWTTFEERHQFQTYAVGKELLRRDATNTIGIVLGEGWYASRLGIFGGKRDMHGSRIGAMAQLRSRSGEDIVVTDDSWKWSEGPIITSEIYDGERYDSTLQDPTWSGGRTEQATSSPSWNWKPVEVLGDEPKGNLVTDSAPIRVTQTLEPRSKIITPSGKVILDFEQNLVGWLRVNQNWTGNKPGDELVLRHAEVLENDELCTVPLRKAKCTDTIVLGGDIQGYQPKFTFHGFRYVQIDGWRDDFDLSDFTAMVVHSDMRRTGWFECSHPLINRLHENVVWGMRGNFVGVPTDCPQRDERLGWTGDLQVFGKVASFLYDTNDMLAGWLENVAVDQKLQGGIPPLVSPNIVGKMGYVPPVASAVWGDVTILTPWDLYTAFGDVTVLERQYESMQSFLDGAVKRGEGGLWDETQYQLGDHLDPDAPPDQAGRGKTDPQLVANAYLVHVTRTMSKIAGLIGREQDAERYHDTAAKLLHLFQEEFVSPNGRLASDSQTSYALAIDFDLLTDKQRPRAADRLDYLIRKNVFKVATGFAGTPALLPALAKTDKLAMAYRMLQEKQCPSWLYPVTMGATTIWERYDSMRPDKSINPSEMTSFNHYALGAIARFMYETIGGLTPTAPGWTSVLVQPRPGGTITSANVRHIAPSGEVSCEWTLTGKQLKVQVKIPPNTIARVVLPGVDEEIGSGQRVYNVEWEADPKWPPKPEFFSLIDKVIDEIA